MCIRDRYNTKEYTARCIESIIKYTKSITYEIIVVDNASSDNTPSFLHKKFKSVTVIKNKKNNYYGGANNQACLLYTSDAADERSSVDLGGRRIIKKKKIDKRERVHVTIQIDWTIQDVTNKI